MYYLRQSNYQSRCVDQAPLTVPWICACPLTDVHLCVSMDKCLETSSTKVTKFCHVIPTIEIIHDFKDTVKVKYKHKYNNIKYKHKYNEYKYKYNEIKLNTHQNN